MPDSTGYDLTQVDLRDIVASVDNGRLALPDFQRRFEWGTARSSDLLTSVARRWPIGYLLTIQGPGIPSLGWGPRPLEGAPELDQPNILVLDGQQRLTALYHAIRDDSSEDVYYCRIFDVASASEVDDDHIKALKKSRFASDYPSVKSEAEHGVIKISRLYDDDRFLEWLQHLSPDRWPEMNQVRNGPLAGLRSGSYNIPAIRLEGEAPLPIVAKMFETVNRGALRLSTFDLMVARMYPYEFQLRDEWDDAKYIYDSLEQMTGLEVLQLIALREHIAAPHGGVKGIRQSDVLELEPGTIKGNWNRAVAALDRAVHFMASCGAVRWNLIPSATMLIPLADALWDGDVSSTQHAQLHRWFWGGVLNQTYAQGANTQAVADAQDLRAWALSGEPPSRLSLAIPGTLAESLREPRPRNQILARGVVCLPIARGARDWRTDKPFKSSDGVSEGIEVHHAFPRKHLKVHAPKEEPNLVVNCAPLFSSSNKSLLNEAPSSVVDRKDVRPSNIWNTFIPENAYRSDDWDGFIERRVEMLVDAFREELNE